MVTVLVLSILLGVAVPSFMQSMRSNRLIAQTNEFVGALNITRSEALKRASMVTVCASSDASTCSGSTNWSGGWIVFDDTSANGVREGGETLLQTWPAVATEFTLNANNRSFVRYTSTGTSFDGAEIFTLLRPSCTGNNARRVVITAVGRINTQTVACP